MFPPTIEKDTEISKEMMMNIKCIHNITGDYHREMSSAIFMKWIETQLLPGFRPGSTIIMNNASYHSIKVQGMKPPTSATRKEVRDELCA